MRLRRENGDFDFVINDKTDACTIQPNLFPEQLIGQIVVIQNAHVVIIAVQVTDSATYTLTGICANTVCNFTYTVATGEVTVVTEGHGG
jgi:hypothetical protein